MWKNSLTFVSLCALLAYSQPVAAVCSGDCSGDGEVTIDELILGVGIALGGSVLGQCPSIDKSMDGEVTIDEIITSVNSALVGCPIEASTPTPTQVPLPTLTPTPGIVPPGISAALIGTWAGRAVNETTGVNKNVRIRIEVVNNVPTVTDIDGNLFKRDRSIQMSFVAAAPHALFANRQISGGIEAFQLTLVGTTFIGGTYGFTTISFPPQIDAVGLELNKQN